MGYHLGVDLGTTFTAAAASDGGNPTMVGLGNRALQIPSVLYFHPDGTLLVGEAAELRSGSDSARAVREFKRRIGDPVPILVGGRPFSAQALSARLLRWVVDKTTQQLGEPPLDVTLTYPANWAQFKVDLLRQVAVLADLESVRACSEPEAAALQYASRARVAPGDRIAVYDLGGGTFDVCVLEKTDTGFRILGRPEGIEHLGGIDFDEALFRRVVDQLPPVGMDADTEDDAGLIAALARLRRDCVEAKEALSTDVEAVVPVALPHTQTSVRLTRGEFEDIIRPAIEETIGATRRALRSADTEAAQLRAMVLVGGSSRIPLIAELLGNAFRCPIAVDTHPKNDVAAGAARAGALPQGAMTLVAPAGRPGSAGLIGPTGSQPGQARSQPGQAGASTGQPGLRPGPGGVPPGAGDRPGTARPIPTIPPVWTQPLAGQAAQPAGQPVQQPPAGQGARPPVGQVAQPPAGQGSQQPARGDQGPQPAGPVGPAVSTGSPAPGAGGPPPQQQRPAPYGTGAPPGSAPPQGVGGPPPTTRFDRAPRTGAGPADGSPAGAGNRNRIVLIAVAVVVLLAGIGTVVALRSGGDDDAGSTTSAPSTAGSASGAQSSASSASSSVSSSATVSAVPTATISRTGLPVSEPLSERSIVVSREIDGTADLFVVNADNGALTPLTSGGNPDRLPVLSPDRGTIIYLEQTGTTRAPRVVAANGAGDRALAEAAPAGCDRVNRIAWNPVQTEELAAVCLDGSGVYSLQIVRVDGTPVRTLQIGMQRVDDVSYSPDGSRLVFWGSEPSRYDGGSIFVIAANGDGGPQQLTTESAGTDADPVWSPDGSEIAFRRRLPASTPQGNSEIFVMAADGSSARQLTDDPANDQEPSWSPDGQSIAFVSDRGTTDAAGQLWVMTADGQAQRQVLPASDGAVSSPAWTRR